MDPGCDTLETGLVITGDPPVTTEDDGEGVDKRKQSKEWCFTYFGSLTGPQLALDLSLRCKKYAFQKEACPKTGTMHMQGQMSLVARARWPEVLEWFPKPNRVRAARNVRASELYCQKEATRIEGPWTLGDVAKPSKGGRPRKEAVQGVQTRKFVSKFPIALRPVPETWLPWQKFVLEIAATSPDERSVWWIWNLAGGEGKTTLMHELLDKFEAQVIGGQLQNVLACATDFGRRLYVVAAPRDTKPEKFPYKAIEMLKDGIWLKGKNDVMPVHRKEMVHVMVFANCPPVYEKFTSNRWKVVHIDEFKE